MNKEEDVVPFMIYSPKLHTVTSVLVYSLEAVTKASPHSRGGEEGSISGREEYQRICGPSFKPSPNPLVRKAGVVAV